jgi:hypothetical protein
MPEKEIRNWLVINWQDGSTRTRKSKPSASSLGTHELATELTLDIHIPEVDVDELRARVEVPKPRVEQTALNDVDAEDAPDWMDVADERIQAFINDHGRDWAAFRERFDSMVVSVLTDAPTRPPVEDVRDYLRQTVREVCADE